MEWKGVSLKKMKKKFLLLVNEIKAWSDNSREWNTVSSDIKQEIGLVKSNDGEFWMSFSDFMYNWVNDLWNFK